MVKSTNNTSNTDNDFAEISFALLGRLLLGVGRLLWWAIRFPVFSIPIAAVTYAWLAGGWQNGVYTLAGVVVIYGVWAGLQFPSFRRATWTRVWKRRRRWAVYTRDWASTCALNGLTATLNSQVLVPRLKKVRIGHTVDVLVVKLLAGQTVTDWSGHADALAHTFGAITVSARTPAPGWVTVTVHHTDTLAAPIPLPAAPVDAGLDRVTIGRTETGTPWLLKMLGTHVLVAGATGAGKASVVWSILAALTPALNLGTAQAWVVDPKGGMEFGRGLPLFLRFSHDTGEGTLTLLRDAAAILTERANRLRGHARTLVPTVTEPLIVLIVDELAALTAYITDRKVKAEVEQLLGLILSQGRAVGVTVIACVQDPSKEVMNVRQLFPTRIGLRLTEPTQVAMVLGQGARERGALCDLIPDALPGTGYITEDGTTELTRVRAFHVTDENIDALTDNGTASRTVVDPAASDPPVRDTNHDHDA